MHERHTLAYVVCVEGIALSGEYSHPLTAWLTVSRSEDGQEIVSTAARQAQAKQ